MARPARIGAASSAILETARLDREAVFGLLTTSVSGLTDSEAAARLAEHGPNEIAGERRQGALVRLLKTLRDPLNILLAVLALLSYLTRELDAAVMISIMVAISVLLRFVQESRANAAAAKLKAMISVTATAVRGGEEKELALRLLVPGDVVRLSAGDMVPADLRLIACKDLFVNQASLTGESLPVEKTDAPLVRPADNPLELSNALFLGTNVVSGSATAVVVGTGQGTYFGGMAASIAGQEAPTSFDRGINRFTWLMIRFMLVMTPLVFLINGLAKHDWKEAFFFAMAVSVGLTPEMLPMIVTVCLSKGALAMSRRQVIVKRLSAIQNLGAMDVLCTDKTGTLTLDRVILEKHCDVMRKEDEDVLRFAYINSAHQTGLKNVLDRAILKHEHLEVGQYEKVDEIPFDFSRRLMSVVIKMEDGRHRLITKGAPEEVIARCRKFEIEGEVYDLGSLVIPDLREEYESLSADGFRVLAIAYRDFVAPKPAYSKEDEQELVLKGYVAFLDPPKDTAGEAIAALRKRGVEVKVLTGDNELVTRKICQEVHLDAGSVVLGSAVEKMSDAELAEAAERSSVFARLSPAHKQRVIRALMASGHVVGFLGDGINDAPALKTADVGISVDTAVDVAKESADVILLKKSLLVLGEGVIEGRRIFANIVKYIKMGASSNFGNMFSVLGASAILPFLPMQPLQILTNNLLYDISQIPIPTDDVDAEDLIEPRQWKIDRIGRFILMMGPISSIFDYTTFAILWFVFACRDKPALFQTGWFVESLLTQTLVIHIIRTSKVPFLQSRASWPLIVTTLAIMAVGVSLPFTLLAGPLRLQAPPPLYWPLVGLTLLGYALLAQLAKMWLARKAWA